MHLQKKRCATVSIEVPKAQHKYIIGHKGSAINEILSLTGVSVEMPHNETATTSITLRGPHDKIGAGLKSRVICFFKLPISLFVWCYNADLSFLQPSPWFMKRPTV